jgi:hypothetical protein
VLTKFGFDGSALSARRRTISMPILWLAYVSVLLSMALRRVWGDGTESRTIFRSRVWAGVRARCSPSLLSGVRPAKASVVLLIIWHILVRTIWHTSVPSLIPRSV